MKRFTGTFCQAQTLKLGGVSYYGCFHLLMSNGIHMYMIVYIGVCNLRVHAYTIIDCCLVKNVIHE